LDLTRQELAGRPQIQSYVDEGFRIAGARYDSSVLLLPDGAVRWAVATFAEITVESLAPVLAQAADIELLVIGAGRNFALPPPDLRTALKTAGIGIECMDTGAACRTYNVLLAEDRRVAAALILPA
jgi:uncharacterized protein